MGIGIAVLGKSKDKEAKAEDKAMESATDATQQTSNPFADVDIKTPTSTRKNTKNLAPPGLDLSPRWVEAAAMAQEGVALVDAAVSARDAGDEEEYKKLGIEGREKIFEAQGKATDFYIEQSTLYPEDRQVESLSRKMKPWGKALKKVRHL